MAHKKAVRAIRKLKRIPKLTVKKRNRMMRLPRGAELMSDIQYQESTRCGLEPEEEEGEGEAGEDVGRSRWE